MKYCHRGFTLLELMIVLSVTIVLLLSAPPVFSTFVANSRLVAGVNSFVGALQLARAESMARSLAVTICSKNTTNNGCLASAQWEQGWLVFIDRNSDGQFNTEDTLLHAHTALDSSITFRSTDSMGGTLTYYPSGLTSINNTEFLVMCDERDFDQSAKGILITVTGRGSAINTAESHQSDCLI